MILVTGATGHLGGATVDQLLKFITPAQFVIFARDEKKTHHLAEKGIGIRIGDFDNLPSLHRAMEGVSKVLLIPSIEPNRLEQNKRVIDAAVQNGVKHLVYAGVAHKNIDQSLVTGLDAHFKTEDYIRNTGITFTFLRNNLYMEALQLYGGENVFETGFFLPAGEGKVPFALRREMGEAAANVLLQDGHENKTYYLGGSESYSYYDVAHALTTVSGKKVSYTPASSEAFSASLTASGITDFIAFILTAFNLDIRNGQFEIPSNDLEKLLGRKPATLLHAIPEVFPIPQ